MDTPPWDRQPLEPEVAYQAFSRYRDAGTDRQNSLRGIADALGHTFATVRTWSKTHRWDNRVAAYRREQARSARTERVDAVKKMAQDHLGISRALMAKGLQKLANLDPAELRPSEAARFIALGVELEQKARGYLEQVEEATPAGSTLTLVHDATATQAPAADPDDADLQPLSFDQALQDGAL